MAYGDTGTPVSLVVPPAGPPPGQDPLPHTGFDLVVALAAGALLLATGSLITAVRRTLPHPAPPRSP